MSIKPIDLQVMIPKTSEIAHQQQAANIQQKAENDMKQVHAQDKANEARIREREERRQSQERNDARKKRDKNSSKEKGSSFGVKTSTIDIKI